jgi:Zn-dependent protease with chaperone function
VSFDPKLPDDDVNVSPTHPLREAALLLGGVAGAVVLLAVGLALLVDLTVPRLPTGLERRIFAGAWLAPDDTEERDQRDAALQQLVDRLAGHWPENPYALRASVWEAETPNAFALPGGRVVVTTGLLERIGSENELAFVLGHELGHFAGRDHLRGLGRGVAFGLVLAALGITGAGGAADLAGLLGQLAQRSFDREQESEADGFGLALVVEEYGHAGGAAAFFRDIPDAESLMGTSLAAYVSTHPLNPERVGELRALAAERGWSAQGELRPLDW